MIRKRLLVTLAVILLFAALTACGNDEEPGISQIDWDDHETRAEQFVGALLNGDFTIASEGFDEEMARLLGVNGLRRAWNSTVRLAGEFVSMDETELVDDNDYEIYHVVTRHKDRDINSRIVFDHNGKIAGLFFSFI